MKFEEWNFRKYKSSMNPKVRYISPKKGKQISGSTTTNTFPIARTTVPVVLNSSLLDSAPSTINYPCPLPSISHGSLASSQAPSPRFFFSPEETSLYPELHLPHFTKQNSFTCDAFSTIDSVSWEENKRDFNSDCIVQKVGGEKLVLGALSLLAERGLARYRRSLVKYTRNDEIALPLPLHPIPEAYTSIIRDTEKRGLEINVSWYIYNLTLERLVRNTLTVDSAYSSPFHSI